MTEAVSALVLAAGLGTRLLPYSAQVPKPLVPILDRTLLEHQFAAVRSMAPLVPTGNLFVNAHHLADQVIAASNQLGVHQVFVEPELLGTGGPLQQVYAAGFTDELLVLNGDCFHEFDLAHFLDAARNSEAEFALLCVQEGPLYLSCNEWGQINGRDGKYLVGESHRKVAFSGVSWYSPKALERIRKDDFNVVDFWAREASQGRFPFAFMAPSNQTWIDMGTPQGLFDASIARLQQLELDRWVSPYAAADKHNLGKHSMVLGNAIIAPGAYIESSVILPGVHVQSFERHVRRIVGMGFTWDIVL